MRASSLTLIAGLASLFCFVPGVLGQNEVSPSNPGYVRVSPVAANAVPTLSSNPVLIYPAERTPWHHPVQDANGSTASFSPKQAAAAAVGSNSSVMGHGTTFGLDTVPLFTGEFAATGGPNKGQLYPYDIVGNDPRVGGGTDIPAKITAVSLKLLNADGSVFKVVSVDPFVDPTLDSPVFKKSHFSDGYSQVTDAIQRAEFFHIMGEGWHTELDPTVVGHVTISVPRFVTIQLQDGSTIQARAYFTGTAPDGSTFVEMLDLLFQFFFDNQVVSDINQGNYTTDAVNMQLYPNTFLFSLNVSDPNVPGGCCVLGFHTYFLDPTLTPQPRWITSFQSWISPGLFGAGFEDVTALSHETAELFNDPFVSTAVPPWQFPGQPANSTVCQGNLETGDPVEVLPNATIALPLRDGGKTFIFHPQNEALLQWFSQGPASNAFHGAFSYPDTTVLPTSAVPCPQ